MYKWIYKLFRIRRVKDVFTPGKAAKINYIGRPKIEDTIFQAFHNTGKQVIMYGMSGSGKTTLIKHYLETNKISYIDVHCTKESTFEKILLQAFDDLNPYYTKSRVHGRKISVTKSAKTDYNKILSCKFEYQTTQSEECHFERSLPPQLSAQNLARLMCEANIVWVIEDFHYMEIKERELLADVFKIFSDEVNNYEETLTKIVCIGAVGTADELIKLNPDIRYRTMDVEVPLLSNNEIREIVLNGCKYLNLKFDNRLVDKILYYSNRIGLLAHQMCFDICIKNKILQTQFKKRYLYQADLNTSIENYLRASKDTFVKTYEIATKDSLGWYIIKTFSSTPKDTLQFHTIKNKVCAGKRSYLDKEIQDKLNELSNKDDSILIYDEDTSRYSLSTPFWGVYLRYQIDRERAATQISKKKGKERAKLLSQNEDESVMLNAILKYEDSLERSKQK